MRELVVCPGCQLKHSRRPDGICPRCSASVDRPLAPASAAELPLPGGPRIAGAVLMANAVAVLVEAALGANAPGLPGHSPVVAAVHDIVVGAMLVAGSRKVLRWSIFRVCAGAAGFSVLGFLQGNPLGVVFQLIFSTSLLLLLLGTPGRPRIALSLALFSALMVLEVAGLVGATTGSNPLARTLMALRGEVERAPERLVGTRLAWQLTTPPGWDLRAEAASRKDNPLSDRWLVRPELDAHILVLGERVPNVDRLDPDALARVVLQNASKGKGKVQVIAQGVLTRPIGARFLHILTVADGREFESFYGVITSGRDAYQVIGFVPRRNFDRVREDFEAAIASFEPAPP